MVLLLRSDINRKHDLVDVIFLVISTKMAGEEGWRDIETYGDSKVVWLKQYCSFHGGIPRCHVLNMLKQHNCSAPSRRNKLKKAGWNENYRAEAFFG